MFGIDYTPQPELRVRESLDTSIENVTSDILVTLGWATFGRKQVGLNKKLLISPCPLLAISTMIPSVYMLLTKLHCNYWESNLINLTRGRIVGLLFY